MTDNKLYSLKQASFISGLSPDDLQIALDRDHVQATVVPVGARTYRKFTREQLLSLQFFSGMVTAGIKPSVASAYVGMIETNIPQVAQPVEYVICEANENGAIALPAWTSMQLADHLYFGAWVIPYQAIIDNLDRELLYLSHMDRALGLEDSEKTQSL